MAPIPMSDEHGMTESIYQFSVEDIKGRTQSLETYRGEVLLIVNTASKCGFTPQYAGLESLHTTFGEKGLKVLGFPCNQFGQQEPGDNSQVAEFCEVNYGVSFPMFAKIDVNGAQAHPMFDWLKQGAPGVLGSQKIKWNFTKFLVDRDGTTIKRFAPTTKPEDMREEIQALL